MFKDPKYRRLTLIQIAIWLGVTLAPAAIFLSFTGEWATSYHVLKGAFKTDLPLLVLYFLNFLILAPYLWYSDVRYGKIIVVVINIALVFSWNGNWFWNAELIPQEVFDKNPEMPETFLKTMVIIGKLVWLTVHFILAVVATKEYKSYLTSKLLLESEQEKRNAAEAELSWLKNQLNPHFLFNSLNNISSLTQIDADKAQESIGELSDLLRYALYETNSDVVPVAGEIEFMENYISLMTLRCNEMTTVERNFGRFPEGTVVAPLLFISLIENAFKHGVNTRNASFIRVNMEQQGHDLVFLCENSVSGNADTTGHAGSGIGLENLARRLDLIYKNKYIYEYGETDGTYSAKVVLKDIVA